MWTIHFSPLFEVEMIHEYFLGGTGGAYVVEPAPWAEPVLRRFGLLFRRTVSGFSIFADVIPGATTRLRKPLDDGVHLSFLVHPADPALLNYSDLPLTHLSAGTYFVSNRTENLRDGKLILGRDTALSELDRMDVRPRRFSHSGVSAAPFAEIEILDGRGDTIKKARVPVVDGVYRYGVDLGGRQPGCYGIRTDGASTQNFFALTTAVNQSPFTVIDIESGPSVSASYRFTAADGGITPKTYTFRIAARRTVWKYSVVLKYRRTLDPNGFSLVSTQPAVTFTRQAQEVLPDGTMVVPFLGDELIPLRDRPYQGIKLTHGGNGAFEIDNLPNAVGSRLTLDPSGTHPCSEIFVYI